MWRTDENNLVRANVLALAHGPFKPCSSLCAERKRERERLNSEVSAEKEALEVHHGGAGLTTASFKST